jgi:molybdopterin-binding protein
MKISARNQIAGRAAVVRAGAINGSVEVDIGNDVIITAGMMGEAIAESDDVMVLVEASDVLIGK